MEDEEEEWMLSEDPTWQTPSPPPPESSSHWFTRLLFLQAELTYKCIVSLLSPIFSLLSLVSDSYYRAEEAKDSVESAVHQVPSNIYLLLKRLGLGLVAVSCVSMNPGPDVRFGDGVSSTVHDGKPEIATKKKSDHRARKEEARIGDNGEVAELLRKWRQRRGKRKARWVARVRGDGGGEGSSAASSRNATREETIANMEEDEVGDSESACLS